MQRIPQKNIQEIREKVDIVDVINQYVQLSKKGSNFMASCPFHEDRNPSFSVSPSKQIFKCFSCGRGGNVFSFIQEIENISFPESVVKVSEYTDVPLDNIYISKYEEHRQENKNLYEIHKQAMEFYHYYLMHSKNGQDALAYLEKREFKHQTLTKFKVGLGPDNSTILMELLIKKGFTKNELIESGIFYQTDDFTLIDRFRNRIIIPLLNERSEPIAFSGRIYQTNQNTQAKYINSPETAIFDKSKTIFNYANARLSARQKEYILVTEGYMDVLTLDNVGFEESVAVMGTSLTNQHLQQLSKITNNIYFVFDGDEAGQEAIFRAFNQTDNVNNVTFKAILIPNAMDPDEYIKRYGVDSFKELIYHSFSKFEFQQEYYKNKYNLEDEEQIAQYIESMITLIAKISSPIEQELRIQDLAQTYNLKTTLIEEQVAKKRIIVHNNNFHEEPYEPQDNYEISESALTPQSLSNWEVLSTSAFQSEKYLLFQLIYHQEAWDYLATLEEPLLLIHDISNQALDVLQRYYYDEGYDVPLTGVIDLIEDITLKEFVHDLFWERELFEFDVKTIKDSLKVIQREYLVLELKQLKEAMKQPEIKNNFDKLNQLFEKISVLQRQIKQ